jgi:DNA-directed RNA polymerase specialized sigma subunit
LHVNMEKIEQFFSLVDEWRGKAEKQEIRLEEVHESEKYKTESLASAIQQLEEKEQLLPVGEVTSSRVAIKSSK